MKNLAFVIALFLCASVCYADVSLSTLDTTVKKYTTVLSSGAAVGTTATAYSNSVRIPGSQYHGAYLKFTGTTVNVKVYIQASLDNSTFVDIESSPLFITVTDTAAHIDMPTIPLCPFIRFKYIGQSGNAADVEVDALWFQDTKVK